MAITILQQPQALTLVGNIPDLIVQTDGVGMTVNITKGATLILAEYYSADEAGRARVLLRDFLNDFLHIDLPTADTDLYEQTRSIAQFGVEIIVGTDTTSFSFLALKGGSSTLNLDCATYLKESWLTWQPQIKKVRDVQPEWLSYYTQAAAVVKIRGYFSGGTSETKTLHTLEAGKHYTMNMTFADLREEFVEQPIYIDAWVENSGGTTFSTYVQRYVLTDEYFEWDDYFLFKNSVGGIDLIRFTGMREATNPIEVDAALFYDEYERDYQVNPRLAFDKNTGYFRSRAELLWALDFFQAKEKYYQADDEFAEIRLLNPEYAAPENTLTSLDFKFSYTRQTLYLSLFKKKSPLIDPIIIGPGDDDYYLPPDIAEFPQQTDPSGLLFPVQKPGTPGWFFITWENMLAEVLANIPAPVIAHDDTTGIKGGEPGDHWHLTEEEHQKVQDLQDPAPQGDRVVVPGTIIFDSATVVSGENWSAVVGGNEYDDFDILLDPVTGTPSDHTRRDIIVIDADGDVSYIDGAESSEGVVQPGTPAGKLLLAFVDRTPAGDNTVYVTPEQLSDFVSKSEEDLQTIQSPFAIAPLAGDNPNYMVAGPDGQLYRSRTDQAGIYSTLQGAGGFSRILRINLNLPAQLNYYAVIEFHGVSAAYEKGYLWVQFQVDSDGDLVTNALKCFGEFDVSKYKLVKVDADHYDLFVAHVGANDFYKFRPLANFGGSAIYTYYQLPAKVGSLPAGAAYSFTLFGDLTAILTAIEDLEEWVLDLDNRVDDLETRPYIEDVIAGTNISIDKTDPKNPIINASGGGGGADPNAVHYDAADGKTQSEQNQARENLGLTNVEPQIVATSGLISDLTLTSRFVIFTGSNPSIDGIDVTGLTGGVEVFLYFIGTGNFTIKLFNDSVSATANRFRGLDILPPGGSQVIRCLTGTYGWHLVGNTFHRKIDTADIERVSPTVIGNSNFAGAPAGVSLAVKARPGTSAGQKYFSLINVSNVENFYVDNNGYIYITNRFNVGSPSGLGDTYNAVRAFAGAASSSLIAFRVDNSSNTRLLEVFCDGTLRHAKSTGFDKSIRRDEQRLYYLVSVTTAGAINDQALTVGIFNYRFTAATSITGFANGEIGRRISIHNDNAVNLDIPHEDAGSIAANRVLQISGATLSIPPKGKAEFEYFTGSRWELVSKNF